MAESAGRTPQTVSEVFPKKWLAAEDLERPVTVKIVRVEVQTVHQRDGSEVIRPILTFEKARKRMICNKTQSFALAEILQTEEFAKWPGHRVMLAPGTAPNGKPTLLVQATPAQEAQNASNQWTGEPGRMAQLCDKFGVSESFVLAALGDKAPLAGLGDYPGTLEEAHHRISAFIAEQSEGAKAAA